MMRSNAFSVTSIQTSDSQQQAKTYGQTNNVVKPTSTDEMPGAHKARYMSK